MNSTLHQLKSPLLTGNCIDAKREEIKQFFINTWTTYESLFSQINNDAAFYKKPERLRHPLIFYYGHTATFFINKLMLGKYITKRINPKLEAICAVGVDEMSWDDLNTDNYDWPSVEEVQEYRDTVYGQMLHVIDTMPLALPVQQDSLAWIVLMGCEHERIHLETSSVIIRMLPLEDLTAHDNWQVCNDFGDSPLNSLTSIPGQSVLLGKSTDDDTYGWDNEYGNLTVDVESFKASTFLVSNQEFLEFVEAGGYQKLDYWNDEGKKWLQFKKPTMPVFWLQQDGEYFQRNLNQIMPLPLNWPVEVNYLEAKAFCVWKSKQTDTHIRMPTEAEWYAMYNSSEGNLNERDTLSKNVNLNHYASSCPVDAMAPSQLDNGKQLFDVVGNVWQWSESAIDGFNGFSVHPLYDDFSTPTFDGKHNLIKGGSWISTGNEANKFSRYAFRRHFFQHAGFRYIESSKSDIPLVKVNVYENDTSVSKQLHSNYSENLFNIENYSTLLAKIVSTYAKSTDTELNRCLDLGCSVGRSSFELANTFSHIDGVDFSARTVQHGVQLQQGGVVRYIQEKEGDIVEYNEISLNNLPHISNQMNIDFSQGDASNLKDKFTDYDVILAQNVLENSYEPIQFLDQLPHRLNDKGLLIVASDYKFDEKITLKNKWIGGVKVNGENVTGFDGLSERLSSHFNFLAEQNIPRVIQNTDREYVVSNIHVTVWQKR